MSNEGDIFTSGKKKHKKKKSSEISDLGGEDGNVQLADESCPNKKMKMKVLGDTLKGVLDLDFGADTDRSSKKKRKEDVNGIDVDTLGDDNRIKGKTKKGKSGDKGETFKVSEVSGETVSKLDKSRKEKNHVAKNGTDNMDRKENSAVESDTGVASDYELLKGGEVYSREEGHTKKKKKKTESKSKKKSNENVGDAEQVKKKKKKKNKSEKCKDAEFAGASEIINIKGSISHTDLIEEQLDNEVIENVQPVKDKKRKKKKKSDSGADILDKELGKNIHRVSIDDNEKSRDTGSRKRKKRSQGCNTEGDANASPFENNETSETAKPSENSNSHKKSKKVKFSENVEVFPLPYVSSKGKKKKVEDRSEEKKRAEDGSEEKKNIDDGLIQGKRFSKEEDKLVQNAVYQFIEDRQLGEEGVEMLMNCRLYPELKGCWKVIGESLPWRPYSAVYYRAHILFERSEQKWTEEEIELVKKFHEKNGPDWKTLSIELGKHRIHVKDVWRRIKLPNRKKGHWSQDEYQNLFNLVNMDLSMKAFTEKKRKHGMLRDNICWEAISDQLTTRSNSLCCTKWYGSLTSPMVAEGKWSNTDDYRMLIALVDLDEACEDDVDWDNLLEHRSGEVCRKRWNQMVRHIGEHGNKTFIEQVEILSQRYCPHLLEARESFDNRPFDD